MPVPTGQRTTYTDTITQKRVVTDLISIIDPMDVPLLNALGYSKANVKKFQFVNFPGTMIEWLEDTYDARSDVAAETGITNSTTTTTLAMTDGGKFQKGDVLKEPASTELVWVSSIATNTLTIVRGFGGTTQTTHGSTVTWTVVSNARKEGVDADDSPSTTPTSNYNYSQILQRKIELSGTRQVVTQYGVADEFDREVEKKMKVLTLLLNNIAYYGQRAAGSASAARAAGGLDAFITTNVTTLTNSPALTQKNVEDAVQQVWGYGGSPDLIVCGAWALKKIRDFYSPNVRMTTDEKRGGIQIDRVLIPPVGELSLLCDRNCPTSELYVLDTSKVGFVPIREFVTEDLAKTGDGDKAQIVGEYSFVLKNSKAHAIVTGFSTSK